MLIAVTHARIDGTVPVRRGEPLSVLMGALHASPVFCRHVDYDHGLTGASRDCCYAYVV